MTEEISVASEMPVSMYRFRVEGVTSGHRSYVRPFDETYEIEGENPADAVDKLVRSEVEWGILDYEEPFTISYLPEAGQ